ncbi:MAG: serine hydrolase domain-containing protein [Solirubrobacteraceae bacterium]|jgi:CubicO group peptidase (beta-lactamase class C family)
MIEGSVAPGFEEVRDRFEANFTRRDEVGAAVAAFHRGAEVVDLWGGLRDPDRRDPWLRDTLVLVYSTSKGLAAMTLALAHSRGWLDYDERVAAYWPEFARNGKERITVRQLLAHQAGLPVVDEPLDHRRLADFDRLAAAIAGQAPAWEPGTRHGYHGLSLGWYEGELIRRVDPRHRTLGRFFAEEIAAPLGLEFYFGLPDDVPPERLAPIQASRTLRALLQMRNLPRGMVLGFARRSSLTARAFSNPKLRGPADLDSPRYRAVEFPAGGGIGQVRSIARAYAALASGGAELGIAPETLGEVQRAAVAPSGGDHDLVLRVPTAYSLGFVKPSRDFRFGSGPSAFGHPGAGGSFAFADPERQVGFAYAPNRLGYHLRDDPREKSLRDALYRCLDRVGAPAPVG